MDGLQWNSILVFWAISVLLLTCSGPPSLNAFASFLVLSWLIWCIWIRFGFWVHALWATGASRESIDRLALSNFMAGVWVVPVVWGLRQLIGMRKR